MKPQCLYLNDPNKPYFTAPGIASAFHADTIQQIQTNWSLNDIRTSKSPAYENTMFVAKITS